MDGKTIRLNRILSNNKILSVPLDHGMTNGPISNLGRFCTLVSKVVNAGATCIICHKGMVRFLPNLHQTGLVIHLSASTDLVNEVNKSLVCNVEEALKYGADAVSVHVNIGNSFEPYMIKDLSYISSQCNDFGMPLIAMMYVRDDFNVNINDCSKLEHAVRIASELGADIVKISSPSTIKELKSIVTNSPIPIIVAGGERYSDDSQLIEKTRSLMTTGIAGVSFGRNIFKSDSPGDTVSSLRNIIFDT